MLLEAERLTRQAETHRRDLDHGSKPFRSWGNEPALLITGWDTILSNSNLTCASAKDGQGVRGSAQRERF